MRRTRWKEGVSQSAYPREFPVMVVVVPVKFRTIFVIIATASPSPGIYMLFDEVTGVACVAAGLLATFWIASCSAL
jgi:hypothetical protein